MESIFADRISDVPKSFIREILKVTVNRDIISFAGGLPNRDFFPVHEIQKACNKVLSEAGKEVLQYSTTEGYLPLRQFISNRYLQKKGLKIDPDEILITNGSQQALDLIAKTVLNEKEGVLIEKPGYLGAIQAFSIYRPRFYSIPLNEDGADIELLEKILKKNKIKLFYSVPNFQNPSGITYSEEKRSKTADILRKYPTLLIEDDPYGELRFMGKDFSSFKSYLPENTILLGSFSKIVAPGFRLGWLVVRKDIMEKVIVAKQGADLHTDYFAQRVMYQYLCDNNIDEHIEKIRAAYKKQRDAMVNSIEKYFPSDVWISKPEGGMFLWMRLPGKVKSIDLFESAIAKNVAFVPGNPFYANEIEENTMRLNFSNSDPELIEEGIKRLAASYLELKNK